jgi:hypothetical protein
MLPLLAGSLLFPLAWHGLLEGNRRFIFSIPPGRRMVGAALSCAAVRPSAGECPLLAGLQSVCIDIMLEHS